MYVELKVLPALNAMSMLRVFIILSVNLVDANPCQTAPYNQDINICDQGTREEDPNLNNVIIRADSMRNCSCELSINSQISEQDIIIGRHGDYDSSHPGEKFGCGLVIDFFHNNDLFYRADCSMGSVKHILNESQRILIKSRPVSGYLQEGSGYCIEIMNERLIKENGMFHLECGLQLLTNPFQTTTADNWSTYDMMSSTDDKTISISTDNISSNNSLMPLLTHNSDSSSSTTIAVGVSVGLLSLLLCIVTAIFVVFMTRKYQRHTKAPSDQQQMYDLFTSGSGKEDGSQYDILNASNVGYQSDRHTLTISHQRQLQNTSSDLNTENQAGENETATDCNPYNNVDSTHTNIENNYMNVI